jgi:hypothetical protein
LGFNVRGSERTDKKNNWTKFNMKIHWEMEMSSEAGDKKKLCRDE